MSIQIFILSKLMQKDTYPYQLKKGLSEPHYFAELIKMSESKLYYHFESLTKQGLIQVVEVIKEENRPDKQVFRITDNGKQQLPIKIYDQLKKAKSITDMVTSLSFLQFVDPTNVIEILTHKYNAVLEKQKKISKAKETLFSTNTLEKRIPPILFVVEGYHQKQQQNELDTLLKLIENIQQQI